MDHHITEGNLKKALFNLESTKTDSVLDCQIGNGFSLPKLLSQVAGHYLNRALVEANQNKSGAAELLGLANYQTFDNWLKKHT